MARITRVVAVLAAVAAVVVISVLVLHPRSPQDLIPPAGSEGIFITDDPEAIAAVRRVGKAAVAQPAQEVLEELRRRPLVGDFLLQKLRAHEEAVVPVLVRELSATDSDKRMARAAACVALCHLGRAEGFSALEQMVADANTTDGLEVLLAVGIGEPLDRRLVEEHAQALGKLVDCLAHPERKVRNAAIQACGIQDLPTSRAVFAQMLEDRADVDLGRVCFWLGRNAPGGTSLARTVGLLFDLNSKGDAYWIVAALGEYCRQDEADLRRPALGALERYLEERGLEAEQADDAALELAAHGDRTSMQTLRRVLRSGMRLGVRGRALEGMVRLLDANEAEALIRGHLTDPDLGTYAIGALGRLKKGTADPSAVQTLSDLARNEQRAYALAAIADALLEIGGAVALKQAVALSGRLGPDGRMRVMWHAADLTATGAMVELRKLGLVGSVDLQKVPAPCQQDGDGPMNEISLFVEGMRRAGIYLAFDGETGFLPVRHDELIRDFAAASRAVFQPAVVHQIWHRKHEEDFEADYTVRFIFTGKLFTFRAKNNGDWYDVPAVLRAVNRALQEAGRKERFVPLYSSGQVAEFMFGDPVAIRTAAGKLFLTLGDDPDAAMKIGKEYEQRVLESLDREGKR